MSIIVIKHTHMPMKVDNGVRQICLSSALNGLTMLAAQDFYNEADYYGIKLWIDAYQTMECAPMPSGVYFKSPLSDEPVTFIQLCSDLMDEWVMGERDNRDDDIIPLLHISDDNINIINDENQMDIDDDTVQTFDITVSDDDFTLPGLDFLDYDEELDV
jgi:hypothetical protein